MILKTPLIGEKLLIMGYFNVPTFNWDNLLRPHLSNRFSSEFIAATQDVFLFQLVQSPTRTRTNQNPTLTDLFFSQDYQIITDVSTSAPLGKSHHNILRFNYTVDTN